MKEKQVHAYNLCPDLNAVVIRSPTDISLFESLNGVVCCYYSLLKGQQIYPYNLKPDLNAELAIRASTNIQKLQRHGVLLSKFRLLLLLIIIIREICKAPTLRLKALNKYNITHSAV